MMNSWLMKALIKLIRKRYALFKSLIIGVLVLSLTACGGTASQDASIQLSEKPVREKNAQLSKKISEVAPPEVIQELRQTVEIYQPQVQILNPQPDEVLQEDKLKVRLQVKDLPIFKDAQYKLGSHLEVILDNQPGLEIYDLNQPLELSDLSPGTHTLRVFASRAWHESFKNAGAYAQTTFHVFTKSDDNNPDTSLPILTYNSPEGSYGAEPILVDFYLTNAPLHILAKDNPDSAIADWRIRCTINGESFIIDRWQSLYLKGFNSGQNWVKLEFLDNQGNPVKNAFNSTVRVINYEPKGKDTLAKIVRGELSSEDLRGIVDSDYAVKLPTEVTPENIEESEGGFFDRFKRGEDKTPTPQPESTLKPIPEVIETPELETPLEETIPEVMETPELETPLEETIPEVIETPQLEAPLEETIPEVIETPQLEAPLEETIPEVIETPQLETDREKPETESKPDGFFNRFKRGKKDKTTIPEVIKTPTPQVTPIPKIEEQPEEITPIPVTPQLKDSEDGYFNRFENGEEEITPQPEKSEPGGFFNRFKPREEDKKPIPEVIKNPTPQVTPIPKLEAKPEVEEIPQLKIESTPELPPTLPEIVEPLENQPPVTQPEAEIEIIPEAKSTTKKLGEYFNLPQRITPVPTPDIEVPSVPVIEQPSEELIEK
ncbi:MAG: hypothetical protein WBA41_13645 [Rivularia sp. (in: cyanobacteria)]